MKAILEFDLENHDDVQAHLRCVKSLDMACAIFEIQTNLRKKLTNILNADGAIAIEYILLDKIFNHLNREFEDNGINIDELIN